MVRDVFLLRGLDKGTIIHGGNNAGGTVTWTLTNVAAGESGSVKLKVRVLATAESVGTVANTAAVKVGSDDPFSTETVTNPVPSAHKNEITPYTGNGFLGAVRVDDEITYEERRYHISAATERELMVKYGRMLQQLADGTLLIN